jgi:hypothetical protein
MKIFANLSTYLVIDTIYMNLLTFFNILQGLDKSMLTIPFAEKLIKVMFHE